MRKNLPQLGNQHVGVLFYLGTHHPSARETPFGRWLVDALGAVGLQLHGSDLLLLRQLPGQGLGPQPAAPAQGVALREVPGEGQPQPLSSATRTAACGRAERKEHYMELKFSETWVRKEVARQEWTWSRV